MILRYSLSKKIRDIFKRYELTLNYYYLLEFIISLTLKVLRTNESLEVWHFIDCGTIFPWRFFIWYRMTYKAATTTEPTQKREMRWTTRSVCCAKGKIRERKEQTNIVISNSKNNGDTVLTVLMYTLYLGSFQSYYA